MRKIFNAWVLRSLLVVGVTTVGVGLSGCGQKAETSAAQTYQIYSHKVSMTPPKDWKVRQEKAPLGPPSGTATPGTPGGEEFASVVFEPPSGGGHIAVTATDGVEQTKEFMNQLANGLHARQGKILKQWYEHKLDDPDKENAYHMEFETLDSGVGKGRQKGMQVQIFTKEKVLYSLIFTANPEVYDAHRATFLALVKSFDRAK